MTTKLRSSEYVLIVLMALLIVRPFGFFPDVWWEIDPLLRIALINSAIILPCLASAEIRKTILEGLSIGRYLGPGLGLRLGWALIAFAVLYASDFILTPIVYHLLRDGLSSLTVMTPIVLSDPWEQLLHITFGVLSIAFVEEFVFRGGLRSLLERFNATPLVTIATSGVIFGAVHMGFGLGFGITAGIAGSVYMLVYLKTGCLWFPIAFHAWSNFSFLAEQYGY